MNREQLVRRMDAATLGVFDVASTYLGVKLGLYRSLADDDPWLCSLDLEYHRLDPAEGLFLALEQTGAFRGVPDPVEVASLCVLVVLPDGVAERVDGIPKLGHTSKVLAGSVLHGEVGMASAMG